VPVPRLKIEIIEGVRFPRALFSLSDRLKNWREFWIRVFLPRYLEQVQQNFATEGELVGGWPDLDPEYAAWKARHFPGRKILELHRRLRNSLMPGASGTSGAGSDTVLRVRPTELVVGTRVPYAKYHEANRPFLPKIRVADYAPLIREWMLEHDARRP